MIHLVKVPKDNVDIFVRAIDLKEKSVTIKLYHKDTALSRTESYLKIRIDDSPFTKEELKLLNQTLNS